MEQERLVSIRSCTYEKVVRYFYHIHVVVLPLQCKSRTAGRPEGVLQHLQDGNSSKNTTIAVRYFILLYSILIYLKTV